MLSAFYPVDRNRCSLVIIAIEEEQIYRIVRLTYWTITITETALGRNDR